MGRAAAASYPLDVAEGPPYSVLVATVVFGDFEWDAEKASSNRTKHKVSFEEAAEANEP